MTKTRLILILLAGLLISGCIFLLTMRLPVTVTLHYTADSDVELLVHTTKIFRTDMNSDSFPVILRRCTEASSTVSFQLPLLEYRFLFFEVQPNVSFQLLFFQYRIGNILYGSFPCSQLYRNFKADNHVASRCQDDNAVSFSTSENTGLIRFRAVKDIPRMLPFIFAGIVFIPVELLLLFSCCKSVRHILFCKKPIFSCLLIFPFLFLLFFIPMLEPVQLKKMKTSPPPWDLMHPGKFQKDFSTWFRYNLPFRQQVFDCYHNVLKKLNVPPVKDVIIGEDSFLFSRMENAQLKERPYDDYLGVNLFTEDELRLILKKLLHVQKVLSDRGIRFVLFIAPNKMSVYPDKVPEKYRRKDPDGPTKAKQLVQYLRQHSSIPVVYPCEELKKAAASVPVPIYYRHDTHWSMLGAYVGAKELFRCAVPAYAKNMPELAELKRSPIPPIRGDLANMMQAPSDFLDREVYTLSDWLVNVSVIDAPGYYGLPGSNMNGPRCFFFRDSFLTSMIPYLARCFSWNAFYWNYQFDLSAIDAFHPDIVVFETVERLLERLLYFDEPKKMVKWPQITGANVPSQFVTILSSATGRFNGKGGIFQLMSNGTALIRTLSGKKNLAGAVDPFNWEVAGVGDFSGKGSDGLLWREKSTGHIYVQNDMTSLAEIIFKTRKLGVMNNGYSIIATGDFIGRGVSGPLFRGPVFGDSTVSINRGLPVWTIDSSGYVNTGWLGAVTSTWTKNSPLKGNLHNPIDINAKNYQYEFVAVGDFNGDCRDDVMIQNTVPENIDGHVISGSGDLFVFLTGNQKSVQTGLPPKVCYSGRLTDGWTVVGTGDFDGDGTDDVLLSNKNSLYIWKMSFGVREKDFPLQSLSADQEIIGIADFNQDRIDDLLVQDNQTGELTVWIIKNASVQKVHILE